MWDTIKKRPKHWIIAIEEGEVLCEWHKQDSQQDHKRNTFLELPLSPNKGKEYIQEANTWDLKRKSPCHDIVKILKYTKQSTFKASKDKTTKHKSCIKVKVNP